MRTLAVIALALLSSASAYAQSQQIQLPPVGGAPSASVGLPQAPALGAPAQPYRRPGGGPAQPRP